MKPIRYLFLDRDGTLIRDRHYLSDPAGVELIPGAAQGLRRLQALGLDFFLVTNQSGIGRGYFSEADYRACSARLNEILAAEGLALKGQAFCPHAPEEHCACRKPGLGMWEELRDRFGLDPRQGVMIGDKAEDVAFGRAAGLRTILVLTGHGSEQAQKLDLPSLDKEYLELTPANPRWPDALAGDLLAAANLIEGWSLVQGEGV